MPTPRAGYFLADGTKVPGTTTVIGRFKESGGLLQWAFQQGKAGKSHLYEEANRAADIGTAAHGMVELSIKGATEDEIAKYAASTLSENIMIDKAFSAFRAYQKWFENFNVVILEQEIQLISEEHRYGGTIDAIGHINGKLALLDWKTSGAIYVDYLIQIAAYEHLWNENHPERPITGGLHILRFSKEASDFAHYQFDELNEAWEQFLIFRKAYDIDKILKKRAA